MIVTTEIYLISVELLLARMKFVRRSRHRHGILNLTHHVHFCLLTQVVDDALLYSCARDPILAGKLGNILLGLLQISDWCSSPRNTTPQKSSATKSRPL